MDILHFYDPDYAKSMRASMHKRSFICLQKQSYSCVQMSLNSKTLLRFPDYHYFVNHYYEKNSIKLIWSFPKASFLKADDAHCHSPQVPLEYQMDVQTHRVMWCGKTRTTHFILKQRKTKLLTINDIFLRLFLNSWKWVIKLSDKSELLILD